MFSHLILSWYATHKRDLPWRNISDPYLIWVSEIILQQTQIVQGQAYYHRFVEAFPTVESLANAEEDEVLRLWQGLGYYSRARNMLKAAKQIVADGGFPDHYDAIIKLPGVGDYTASAISSFAFGQPCAVVDGNVYRVLSRYFGIPTPIDTTQGKKLFKGLAQRMLPHKQSADYNQAMMDFGAMQCTPQSPKCESCPLADSCEALRTNRVEAYPVKAKKVKSKQRYFVYVRVETPEGVLLSKRQKGDIWQGLYEYPLLEFSQRPNLNMVLSHPMFCNVPSEATWSVVVENVKHVLTHQVINASLYSLTVTNHFLLPHFIVVSEENVESYALPQLLIRLNSFL